MFVSDNVSCILRYERPIQHCTTMHPHFVRMLPGPWRLWWRRRLGMSFVPQMCYTTFSPNWKLLWKRYLIATVWRHIHITISIDVHCTHRRFWFRLSTSFNYKWPTKSIWSKRNKTPVQTRKVNYVHCCHKTFTILNQISIVLTSSFLHYNREFHDKVRGKGKMV